MARRTPAAPAADTSKGYAAAGVAGALALDEGTVPMFREEPAHPGGPTTADVHPEEVEAMQRLGWRVVEA